MQARFLQHVISQASNLFSPATGSAKAVTQCASMESRCLHILAKHVSLDYLENMFVQKIERSVYPKTGQQLNKAGLLTLAAYANSTLYSKMKALHEQGKSTMNSTVREEMSLLEQMALQTLQAIQPDCTHCVYRNMVMDRGQIEQVKRNMRIDLRPVTSVSLGDQPFYTGGNVDLKIYTPQGVIQAQSMSDYKNEKLGLLPPNGYLKVLHFQAGHDQNRIRSTPLPDEEFPKLTVVCEHQLLPQPI